MLLSFNLLTCSVYYKNNNFNTVDLGKPISHRTDDSKVGNIDFTGTVSGTKYFKMTNMAFHCLSTAFTHSAENDEEEIWTQEQVKTHR